MPEGPVTDAQHVVVLGGRAANLADRTVDWDPSNAAQVVSGAGAACIGIDPGPGLGISSAVSADSGVVAATETRVYFPEGVVDGLVDVHEMSVVGSHVWVPSTGTNEVVKYEGKTEVERLSIGEGYHHCNQVFQSASNELLALVHHVRGRQFHRRVKGRLLKSHGDGGFIGLRRQRQLELGLSAPHSARVVNGENWVLDSGRAQVVRFDPEWAELGRIQLSGWGRGAVQIDGTLWVGLSPLRRRYANASQIPPVSQPTVVGIDTATQEVVETIMIDGLDQINGLFVGDVEELRKTLGS